jgi:acetamidase/formamidase
MLFHCHDSSAGQLGPGSTLADVTAPDFGRINPVSGPIHMDGAAPGDAYMLASTCGDLRFSEIVDQPNWVVSFCFPRCVFD